MKERYNSPFFFVRLKDNNSRANYTNACVEKSLNELIKSLDIDKNKHID